MVVSTALFALLMGGQEKNNIIQNSKRLLNDSLLMLTFPSHKLSKFLVITVFSPLSRPGAYMTGFKTRYQKFVCSCFCTKEMW